MDIMYSSPSQLNPTQTDQHHTNDLPSVHASCACGKPSASRRPPFVGTGATRGTSAARSPDTYARPETHARYSKNGAVVSRRCPVVLCGRCDGRSFQGRFFRFAFVFVFVVPGGRVQHRYLFVFDSVIVLCCKLQALSSRSFRTFRRAEELATTLINTSSPIVNEAFFVHPLVRGPQPQP